MKNCKNYTIDFTRIIMGVMIAVAASGGVMVKCASDHVDQISGKDQSTDIVTVANSGGDYDSLLRALKETDSKTKIIIKKGKYNIFDEYMDYYGDTFWDDYTGYLNSDDPFYRGLWMEAGRNITGEMGVVIDCQYSGDNDFVKTYFSTFANTGDVVLKNVTIMFSNIRYAIHDDFSVLDQTVQFQNIRFIRSDQTTAIGGGLGSGGQYIIEGCTFDSYGGDDGWDINYHASGGKSVDNKCEIRVTNCYGARGCGFWSNGPTTEVTECYVSNSKFKKIICYTIEGYTQEINMHLTEWCNEVDK